MPIIKKYQILILITGLVFGFSAPLQAAGNCSPYLGKASLNEFFKDRSSMAYDADDFVEVKILDGTINSAIFNSWTIQICEDNDAGNNNDADGCSGTIPLSTFNNTTPPWLVLQGNIGIHVNFKTGFDAILLDGNGDLIDYTTVDGYSDAITGITCNLSNLVYDYQASAPGASDKFIFRSPDGTGDWGSAPSASAPPSEDETNDEDPDGNPAPTISVADVTVTEGNTATFTFTLSGAPKTYDVTVLYSTQGGTAIAGTDYINTTGTATILAGAASTTVNVPTIAGSPSGLTYFFLYLSNPVNSTIENNYPTGTIIPTAAAASAEWYMDETSWTDQPDEVSDVSGNTNHGTPYRGVDVAPGYLCNGGDFNGTGTTLFGFVFGHYAQVPHSNSLNGDTALTYSTWIKPDAWGAQRRQVMGKSVHDDNAQMGIFADGGVLRGRAVTLAGPYEVTTTLPATGSWTHVALVFSGTELRLYINGNVVAATIFNATTLVQTTDPLMIGRSNEITGFIFGWASNFDGMIDETLVFKEALPASFISQMYTNYTNTLNWDGTGRSCPGAGIHHIEFIHDGSALTCNPEQITIKACTNSAIPCTPYTSAVTVGLLPTGWVGGDTKTFTSVSGSSNYNLQHTTAEQITLNTSSVTPSASNSVICRNSSSGPAVPCTMDFHDSGFIFDATTQTSCVTSSNITISAVRKSPTTEQCVPFFDGKAVPLKLWTAYSDPATGSNQSTLNYSGTDYPLDTAAPGTDITMTFDNNGQAQFTLTYPDAGELNLNATYTGSVATSDAGLSMSGNQTYVTKPAKLYVYSDDANAACATNDATCSAFKPAGNAADSQFNLKIRAACADNSVTPNFALNNIAITHTNTAPAGISGNITVTSFDMVVGDAGEHIISNLALSEVGVFTFTATSPNYLGVSGPLGTSTYIGRFYPHHFDTTVTQSCGTFTYSGQDFTVTTTAQNNWLPSPAATQNYTGTFAFDTTLSNAGDSSNFNGTNTIPAVSFLTGTASKADVAYTFPTKETVPTTITLRANDADSGTSAGVVEGTTEIRSGRTRLENTYGSELADLNVPARVEFFNTNGFEINTLDTCSTVTATLTDIGADPIQIGTGLAGETCIWDNDAESGSDNCTNAAILPGAVTSQFEEPPIAGSFNLFLLAPGANNTGDIGVTLNSPSWLQFDWDGDGTHDNDPTGVASFGLYRGDDRVIYWREVFN